MSQSPCVFVMYPHYIPCARACRTYSCSEELAKVFTADGEHRLLVSFTAYFYKTNAHAALSFMKTGAIAVFQRLFDGRYGTFYPPSSIDNKEETFQGEVYQCLAQHPISLCCTGDKQNRIKIVAYFVNFITYSCTADYKIQAGELGQSYKNALSKCLGKVIDEKMKDDCEPGS
ncbi:hypothetical protein BaRGS_00035656 [Batillaria attramentaria]|uniref:Uncharacterized protein n=1 Tax=Batillaria attramentaria TaxID=370345 RepID=A0ABD0JE11_9CAEN